MRGKLVFGLMCAACIVSCKQPEVKESGPRPVKVTKALPLNVVENLSVVSFLRISSVIWLLRCRDR